MNRSCRVLCVPRRLLLVLIAGWAAWGPSVRWARAGETPVAPVRPVVAMPARNLPQKTEYPEPLATELKALGCEGYGWEGESRILANKKLTDQGLARIAELAADLPNLLLSLNRSGVTDEGLKSLRKLGNLRSLWISEGAVTDAGLAHLAELDRLERLSISQNDQITDAGLRHLGTMTDLKELALSRTGVTNAGLPFLSGMKSLKKLSVEPLLIDVERLPELHDALLAASDDLRGTVQVFDVATGRVRFVCLASTSWLPSLMFSADGTVAALVAHERLSLLDTKTGAVLSGTQLGNLDGESQISSTICAALSPDGAKCAVARKMGNRRTLYVLDTRTMAVIGRFPGELGSVMDLEFSSDGKRLLVLSTPGLLWDLATGKIAARLELGREETRPLGRYFSPDEKKVATASSSEVQLWDVAAQACEVRWKCDRLRGAGFDAAGRLLALATPLGRDATSSVAQLHDAATGRLVRRIAFPEPIRPTDDLVLAPDGRRVAYCVGTRPKGASTVGGQVYVCDVTTGKLLTVVEVPEDHYLHGGLDFTQDGERLILFSRRVSDIVRSSHDVGSPGPRPLPTNREPTVANRLAALGCSVRTSGGQSLATVAWEDFSDTQMAEAAPLLTGFPALSLKLEGVARLSDKGLEPLRQCDNLVGLSMTSVKIGDAGLAPVGRLSSLERLALNDMPQIGDAGMSHLAKLDKLEILTVEGTAVGDEGLAHLAKLPSLTTIGLSGNGRITDAGLGHLAESSTLETIDLRSTEVTDRGLFPLAKLGTLKSLSLDRTRVNFELPGAAAALVNLNQLRVEDCPLGDQGMANLLAALGPNHVGISPIFLRTDLFHQFDATFRKYFNESTGTRLWNPGSGDLLRIGSPELAAFSPRGAKRALASTADFQVFDLDTGVLHRSHRVQPTVGTRDSWFFSGAISPDGRLIAGPTWPESNVVRLFDVDSRNELSQLAGHRGPVHSVVFSPDGRQLLTAARGARLWDVATRSLAWQIEVRPDDWVRSARFSPDGSQIVLQYGCGIERWDVATRKRLDSWEPSGEDRFVQDFCFRDDGRLLVLEEDFQGENLAARVIDVAENQSLCKVTAPGRPGEVVEFLLSPEGKWLAANTGKTIELWDASTGRPHRSLPGNERRSFAGAVFVPDGRLLTEE